MAYETPTEEEIAKWKADYPFPLEKDAAGNVKSPEISRRRRHWRISVIAFDLAVFLMNKWNGQDPELTEIFERARKIMKNERKFRSKYDVISG